MKISTSRTKAFNETLDSLVKKEEINVSGNCDFEPYFILATQEYIFVWSIGLHLSDVIAGKPGNHLGLVQEKAM